MQLELLERPPELTRAQARRNALQAAKDRAQLGMDRAARRACAFNAGWCAEALEALRKAVARSVAPLQRYRCAACGFEAQHYFWQCPGCLSWDSYPPQRIDAL